MNRQEVFDKVYVHLLTQKAQSFIKTDQADKMCAYRGENGLMCAVGCLITDEAYTDAIEELPVNTSDVRKILNRSGIEVLTLAEENFLYELQNIHDNIAVENWEKQLKIFANEHNLTIPELTKETK